ncbi:YqgE/AlgH family protein [Wenzhouxiangella sp. XN79A]|uniref:YqgE/AlgH family protein n=1 Tax=Wenzhouxiangella sp. XN79A TaxID=2724193 RepID=UPI00144AEEA9|nr:YqgE/AlgH family protein [Wenzhouxiangella sp. XN79A]NKI35657.1 YqgE/AlgH family protein [Wenzhouxiangella sp. XN79A]
MPGLDDPNFDHGVTLMCQHNDEGALGITINRHSDLTLKDVLAQLDIPCEDASIGDRPVLAGGPVQQERGFVLHTPDGAWESTTEVAPGIMVTTSRDVLEAIAEHRGPEKFVVALGYAGWSAGQLEEELRDNAWLNTNARSEIVFDLPIDDRWMRAVATLGIDAATLQPVGGHA